MIWLDLVTLLVIALATVFILYAIYDWQDSIKVSMGTLSMWTSGELTKLHTNVVRIQKELSEDWRPIGRQYRKHRWVYDSASDRIGFIDEDNSTSQTLRVVFGYTGDLTRKSRIEVDMPIDAKNLTELSSFQFMDNERSSYGIDDRRVRIMFNTPTFGEKDNQSLLCIPIEPNMIRLDVGNLLTGHLVSPELFCTFADDMNLPRAIGYFKTTDIEDVSPRRADYFLFAGDMLLISYMGPDEEDEQVSHVVVPFNAENAVFTHTRHAMGPVFYRDRLLIDKNVRLAKDYKEYSISSYPRDSRIIAINRVKSFRVRTGSLSHSIVQEVVETMPKNCLLESLNQIGSHWTKEIDLWFDITVETLGSPVTVRLHWGNVWCIYPFLVPNSTCREWIDHDLEAAFLTEEAKEKQCQILGFFDPMLYGHVDTKDVKIKCKCEMCKELNVDDDEEEVEDTRIPLGSSPDPAYDVEPPLATGMADAALAVFGPDSVTEAALRELLPSMSEPVKVKPIVPEQEASEAIGNAVASGEIGLVYPPESLSNAVSNAIKEESAADWSHIAEIWNKVEQEREKEYLAQPEEGPGDV